MLNNVLYILVVLLLVSSCRTRTENYPDSAMPDWMESVAVDIVYADPESGDTVRHARMKYYDFDSVKNLIGFFDALSTRYPVVKWSGEEDNIDEVVHECIVQIDSYRNGERLNYPDSLVNYCFNYMGFNIAAVNNHSPDIADLVLAEWVMMCAAYYSPDINCLVENKSPDSQAGYYNFGSSYNPIPWWPYLFLKRQKGYEVMFLGDYFAVHSIHKLLDEKENVYYLFSDHHTPYSFDQWLFWVDESRLIRKVAECHEEVGDDETEQVKLLYEQNELIWKYYNLERKKGRLIPFGEGQEMRLVLDGVNSKFVKSKY